MHICVTRPQWVNDVLPQRKHAFLGIVVIVWLSGVKLITLHARDPLAHIVEWVTSGLPYFRLYFRIGIHFFRQVSTVVFSSLVFLTARWFRVLDLMFTALRYVSSAPPCRYIIMVLEGAWSLIFRIRCGVPTPSLAICCLRDLNRLCWMYSTRK